MSFNPYSTSASTAALGIAPQPPRPISVWLMLIVLAVIAILNATGAALLTVYLAMSAGAATLSVLANTVLWRVVLCAVSLVAVRGIYRRQPWSRWIGLFAVLVFAVVFYLMPDTTVYANNSERAGGFVARQVVLPLLMAWWAYALAFSAKARRYFAAALPAAPASPQTPTSADTAAALPDDTDNRARQAETSRDGQPQ